jgi:pyruvate formate lyase activating enzyme
MTTGIIFDIKRYAIHDGPGIRTTVFFKGCPLGCWWCHNPEGKKCEPETIVVRSRGHVSGSGNPRKKELFGREVTVGDVMTEIRKDRIFYDQSGGGVTLSGGEPMMQMEFLTAVLHACKAEGISTALDTCGHAPLEDFEKISELVDIYLYDLKMIDDNRHLKYTGVSNRLILDNLMMLSEKGHKIILRIPLIPGVTDTDENIKDILRFIEPVKTINEISLLPYNKLGEDKLVKFGMRNKLGNLNIQTRAELVRRAERFRSHGYKVQIGG